jgi:hypothetical protein
MTLPDYILAGPAASRPAHPSCTPCVYIATDTGSRSVWNGTSWAMASKGGWTQGTDEPSGTMPVGSLYRRTDGVVGAALYISKGDGTWSAVAGI